MSVQPHQVVAAVVKLAIRPAFGLPLSRRLTASVAARSGGTLVCPEQAALLRGRFLAELHDPVRVIEWQGERFVRVLGLCVVWCRRDGTLAVFDWWSGKLAQAPSERVSLLGMPTRVRWLRVHARAAARELLAWARRRGIDTSLAAATNAAEALFREFLADARANVDLAAVRREVAAALRIDRQSMRVAARLALPVERCYPITVADYNLAVSRRQELAEVDRHAPALLPIYVVLSARPNWPVAEEPLAALRSTLIGAGLSARHWRWMLKRDRRILRPLLRFFPIGTRGEREHAVIEYLRVLELLHEHRRSRPLSPSTIERVLTIFGNERSREHEYCSWIRGRRFQIVLADFDDSGEVSAERWSELDLVLRWAYCHDATTMDERQRSAGWPWLVRTARRWCKRALLQVRSADWSWPVLVERLDVGGLQWIGLGSQLELWDEGLAMHHCADMYWESCAHGESLVFSLRDEARRIATARLELVRGEWQLAEVAGPANLSVSGSTRALLEPLLAAVRARQAVLGAVALPVRACHASTPSTTGAATAVTHGLAKINASEPMFSTTNASRPIGRPK